MELNNFQFDAKPRRAERLLIFGLSCTIMLLW